MTSPRRCWASACCRSRACRNSRRRRRRVRAAIDEAIDLSGKTVAAAGEQTFGEIKVRALLEGSDLAVTRGDMKEGLSDANAAIDIARPLNRTNPTDRGLMILLADTLERAGNINGGISTAFTVPKKLDPELPVPSEGLDSRAALAAFEESAKTFRKLVAADASDADARARLENILIRIGDLQISTGALDAALASHKEALTISSELLSADSGNTEWKRRVEVNHAKLFFVYMARRDFDEALAQAKESEEIGRPASTISTRRTFYGGATTAGDCATSASRSGQEKIRPLRERISIVR